jgi:hypothetical protein
MATTPRSKNILKSKTFWLNVIGIAATVAPGLPVSPEQLVYIVGGLNVANRVLTTGPVHVLRDAAEDP